MKNTILAAVIFVLSGSFARALCGSEVGKLKPGNKVVGIELKKTSFGQSASDSASEYAMDDDGYLAITLVAAYCNQDVARPHVKLSEQETYCSDEAQRSIKYDDRIDFYYYLPKFVNNKAAQKILKDKCGLDAISLWQKVNSTADAVPLKCVDKVKDILNKAVARGAEYVKEQTQPSYLAKIAASQEHKDKYVQTLKDQQAHSEKLLKMFSSTPVKTGDFKNWVSVIHPYVKQHGYQVTKSPTDPYDSKQVQPLEAILSSVNATLPFVMRSRCGQNLPDSLIDTLKTAVWEKRGSASSNQGGTVQNSEGAKQ